MRDTLEGKQIINRKKLKIICQVFRTALTLAWTSGNFIIKYTPWNTLDWILPQLEQLMTSFIPSLTLFLKKTFCLISLVMLLLVL